MLAAPATPETTGLINQRTLALMKPTAMLVNVARGNLIDSRALLSALDQGMLSAVALDVTDPEPLPDGHSFFNHPKVLITPHVANPPALKRASFARHVQENCRRFNHGEPLLGVIQTERGTDDDGKTHRSARPPSWREQERFHPSQDPCSAARG